MSAPKDVAIRCGLESIFDDPLDRPRQLALDLICRVAVQDPGLRFDHLLERPDVDVVILVLAETQQNADRK